MGCLHGLYAFDALHSSDDLYLMVYEAVYLDVDEDASTYPEYQLTHQPV